MYEGIQRGFYRESFVKRVRLLHVSLSATQTSRSVAPIGVPAS
jgi:hypothetical protein